MDTIRIRRDVEALRNAIKSAKQRAALLKLSSTEHIRKRAQKLKLARRSLEK